VETHPARRTRNGALVVVLTPAEARALVGELVDLCAPSGERATGRIARLGHVWADEHGVERVYAYVDPSSVVSAA
jgi:hypothetical protein